MTFSSNELIYNYCVFAGWIDGLGHNLINMFNVLMDWKLHLMHWNATTAHFIFALPQEHFWHDWNTKHA